MYLPCRCKLNYKHVAFICWPPKLSHVVFKLHGGYLPTYLVRWLTLCIIPIKKNHPSGLKRWSGKFSTMHEGILRKKILNQCCLLLHDHFGEFLVEFALSQQNHEWFVSCENHL